MKCKVGVSRENHTAFVPANGSERTSMIETPLHRFTISQSVYGVLGETCDRRDWSYGGSRDDSRWSEMQLQLFTTPKCIFPMRAFAEETSALALTSKNGPLAVPAYFLLLGLGYGSR